MLTATQNNKSSLNFSSILYVGLSDTGLREDGHIYFNRVPLLYFTYRQLMWDMSCCHHAIQ